MDGAYSVLIAADGIAGHSVRKPRKTGPSWVPVAVVAEWWRGGRRQAQILKLTHPPSSSNDAAWN
jgi:hypothetical protein